MLENDTISYYDQNADSFVNDTLKADMGQTYKAFLSHIPEGGAILDFGSGSGRDSKFFLDQGYKVEAFDGSIELCNRASQLLGFEVKCMDFMDFDQKDKYDGIWACASLLHLEDDKLEEVLKRIVRALKKTGICYASFKYGDFTGVRKGRFFNDMTEEGIRELCNKVPGLKIDKMWISSDVREDRKQDWINIILVREKE